MFPKRALRNMPHSPRLCFTLLIAHRSFQQLWHHVPPTESTPASCLTPNKWGLCVPARSSFVPACPPIRGLDPGSLAVMTSPLALIGARTAKVRALIGSYEPSLSPYHSITPLCWWGLRTYMDSNEWKALSHRFCKPWAQLCWPAELGQ